jgi:hypothetical protein
MVSIAMGLNPFNKKLMNCFGSCYRETDRIGSGNLEETAEEYGCKMGLYER